MREEFSVAGGRQESKRQVKYIRQLTHTTAITPSAYSARISKHRQPGFARDSQKFLVGAAVVLPLRQNSGWQCNCHPNLMAFSDKA